MPFTKEFKHFSIFLLLGAFLSSCQHFEPLAKNEARLAPKRAPADTDLRKEVVSYALRLTGSKYRYGGKSRSSGFDCSGFVNHVLNEKGIKTSGPSNVLENEGRKISLDEVQAGDLLFFRRSKGGRVFHVSLVVSNSGGSTKIIHATSSRGVVVDILEENSYWRSKIITARDVIGQRRRGAKTLP